MAYLTETPDRPLLAIVGGRILESRLKLIDGLLDLVDTLAVGGELSVTFLAAMGIKADDAIGCSVGSRKRMRRWGKGCAGLPRDPPEVFIAARRLLVKARKRRVEVRTGEQIVVHRQFAHGGSFMTHHAQGKVILCRCVSVWSTWML